MSVIVYLSLISNSISTTILFIPILTFVFFLERKFELRMLYLGLTFIALFATFFRFWPEVGIAGASLSGLSSESLSDCILATIFTGIFIRSHSVFSRLTIEVAKAQALKLEESISKTKSTIRELEDQREHLSTIRKKTSDALEGERAAARGIRASQEQLEQFAYAASHDLKEPIRTVRSFFQVIRRRANPDVLAKAEIAKYVSLVESKSSSMHNMLERLLLFSRLSSHQGTKQVQSLRHVINEVLVSNSIKAEMSIRIDAGAEDVYMDVKCATRVFSELVSNATTYVSLDRPNTLMFKAEKLRKGYITCALTDNGVGIDAADLVKVTGLFQRLSSDAISTSSGLGLSIVKAIVEREGGELWLTSSRGIGTTVHFELPIGEKN